jgi:hypothetical protein
LLFGAHPEFGYFCLGPRLRRKLRFLTAIGILGLLAAGSASGIFSRSQEAPAGDAYALAPPEELVSPGGTITTMRGAFGRSAPESGSIFSVQPTAKVEPGKSACQDRQENTWRYLDGQCGLDKPRKMRNVHVMTERPPIAAVAIGHSRSAPRGTSAADSPAAAVVGVPAIIAARPSVTAAPPAPAAAPAVAAPAAAVAVAPDAAAAAPSVSAPAPTVKKPAKPAPPPTRVVNRRERDEISVRRSEEASVRRSTESPVRHTYTNPYAAPVYHYGAASQYRPGWSLF